MWPPKASAIRPSASRVIMACAVAGVSRTTFYDWLAEAGRGPFHGPGTVRHWLDEASFSAKRLATG
jgi:hypothetical protein